LVRHILHHTKNAMENRIRNNELTWKRIFAYLNSYIFSGTIDDCRATLRVDDLFDEQKKICRDIYLRGKIIFLESDDNNYLIRTGFLVITIINNRRYCIYFLQHLLLSDRSSSNIMGDQKHVLILLLIRYMSLL
jgi:hypothetical protein